MHSSAHYRQLLARLPQIAVAADQFQVLNSAKDFKSRILSLIAGATQRIYLIALYLQDDEAGREILSALYAAKQRNPALDIKATFKIRPERHTSTGGAPQRIQTDVKRIHASPNQV
jgi:CDP-diacylglycerol--serine O-phosphatidyltransferase